MMPRSLGGGACLEFPCCEPFPGPCTVAQSQDQVMRWIRGFQMRLTSEITWEVKIRTPGPISDLCARARSLDFTASLVMLKAGLGSCGLGDLVGSLAREQALCGPRNPGFVKATVGHVAAARTTEKRQAGWEEDGVWGEPSPPPQLDRWRDGWPGRRPRLGSARRG